MSETIDKGAVAAVNGTATDQKPKAPKPYRKLPLDEAGHLIEREDMILGPLNTVNVSYPKMGKTFNMINQPNFLIGDADDGTRYFQGNNVVNLKSYDGPKEFIKLQNGAFVPAGIWQTVDELRRANNMKEYWPLKVKLDGRLPTAERKQIHKDILALIQAMKFPIFVIDTITSLQLLNNKAALAEYNFSTFGDYELADLTPEVRQVIKDKYKKDIKRVDNFSGVQYIRRNFNSVKAFIENNAAPFIMWNGHIGMKKKQLSKGEDDISVADIALEGLLSYIFTANADSVCTTYRNDEGVFMDFTKKEETDFGSRPEHIRDKVIKIADLNEYDGNGKLIKKGKTYWDRIYPELKW